MPADYNYMTPDVPIVINGKVDATSQRFHVCAICYFVLLPLTVCLQDTCELTFEVPMPETPPFDLKFVSRQFISDRLSFNSRRPPSGM
jgi:hypothetical protein